MNNLREYLAEVTERWQRSNQEFIPSTELFRHLMTDDENDRWLGDAITTIERFMSCKIGAFDKYANIVDYDEHSVIDSIHDIVDNWGLHGS